MKVLSSSSKKVTFSEPSVFADHQKALRSGHLGHAMVECKDGTVIAFYTNASAYQNNGHTMYGWVEYKYSSDRGVTWGEPFKCAVAKIARNPQVGYVDGVYILHARSVGGDFVVYCSDNGIDWDEGTIVSELLDGKKKGGYYSNNITLKGADGKDRLLIQFSEDYMLPSGRVNVMHAWVECE